MLIPGLGAIRRGEGRNVWAAFFMLFGLIGSHMVLETARDALFLASLPAERLPFVYIGIAIFSFIVTQLQLKLAKSLNRRRALSIWTGLAAAVTFMFWALLDEMGSIGFFALYIWSGVLTTLVLVHFWVLLSDTFTVTQAKRLYGFIGTGSVAGAIAGSAIAGACAPFIGAQSLLLMSAIGFAVTALVPFFLEDVGVSTMKSKAADVKQGLGDSVRYIFGHPYTRSIVILILLTTASVTLADFIFKATVAEHVEPEKLGGFFAWFYFATNVASFFAQVFLVNYLLKRFDIAVALSVLPVLLLVGAFGMLVLPGLIAAIVIKGADGTLRHSLQRTTNELLFLPLTDHVRARVKAFIDTVGQRGGQALISVVILALTFFGANMPVIAGLLVVLGLAWMASIVVIRKHYLDVFRGRLQLDDGFSEFPELDMASLETLFKVLDSHNDAEAVAALDVLESENKARLVPSFILYHPSEKVVDRALSLFVRNGRDDVVPVVRKLLERDSEPVRAAAIAAISVLAFDERELRTMLSEEESSAVRASIMVNLIASGSIQGTDAEQALDAIVSSGKSTEKIGLVQAIARRDALGFDETVERLAVDADTEVQLAVARAVGRMNRAELLPVLLQLLVNTNTRALAQASLVKLGDEARVFLVDRLADVTVDPLARWQIPQTLVMFDLPEVLAPIMLQQMPNEKDGMLRYRMILALEDMLDDSPGIVLDREVLLSMAARNVSRAFVNLDRRIALERGAAEDSDRATTAHELLRSALLDKEAHAIDRVLRLLGLAYRKENFHEIREGLTSGDAGSRVSAIELIENVVEPPLRGAVVGLCEEADDDIRLRQAGPYHATQNLDYEALMLQLMEQSSSIAIRALAVMHAGELRIQTLTGSLERLLQPDTGDSAAQMLVDDARMALRRIRGESVEAATTGA